jgi:acetylornithine deacetylase/succinyl-diaminopimelate desuccinylase-like protein
MLIAAAVACHGGDAFAQAPDPDETRQALAALLAAAAEPIRAGSTCAGDYLSGRPPTVGDLLAMQLAYLHKGDNVIAGTCEGMAEARCTVSIRHSAGESKASAVIRFRARRGKARVETLDCTITP